MLEAHPESALSLTAPTQYPYAGMAVALMLPAELLDEIIATVAVCDKKDLVVLSSVCRTLRDASISHLFSDLKVKRKDSFEDLVHFLETHATVSQTVKRLWLRNSHFVQPSKSLININNVKALLAALPQLERLYFESITFAPVYLSHHAMTFGNKIPVSSSSDTPTITPAYRLQRVQLDKCGSAEHPNVLFNILSLCEIEDLRITLSFVSQRGELNPSWLPRLLRVRNLRLGIQARPGLMFQRSSALIYDALRKSLEPGYLRSLDVKCESWGTVENIGSLLHEVGSNVVSFALDALWAVRNDDTASDPAAAADRWSALSLSSCAKLETFEFCLPFMFLMVSPLQTLCNACAAIIRLLPPSLRNINLVFNGFPGCQEIVESSANGDLDLRVIETAFMDGRASRYPQLASVTVRLVDCAERSGTCQPVFAQLMPRSDEAGLLQVASDGDSKAMV